MYATYKYSKNDSLQNQHFNVFKVKDRHAFKSEPFWITFEREIVDSIQGKVSKTKLKVFSDISPTPYTSQLRGITT